MPPVMGTTVARVLSLGREAYLAIVSHALHAYPEEACGLLVGPTPAGPAGGSGAGAARVVRAVPARNEAASARVYTVHPLDLLRADREAEQAGFALLGVYHSHTHTAPFPSPTDVAQAPDPSWHYVLVSLAAPEPALRSYRIEAGKRTEEPVVLEIV